MEELEPVFRALAHPHRRHLLDQLRARDGQALSELEASLPSMTRFGVMKHLRVLADAGLLTTRKAGRSKLHFLNPVPIQLIADRWISRYAEPFISGMADMKHTLEASPMNPPKHVYQIYIAATPEKIWQAITDSSFTRRYYYNNTVESDWKVGSSLIYRNPDGSVAIESEIVEAQPPTRLVQTFSFPATGDRPSRVTWEIQPRGGSSLLTLLHDDFDSETETFKGVAHGWIPVLSGLKTLLETGEPLAIKDPEHAEATA
jgi:uncharacterized protein YndB with AHSA1/START domain/DNA-binding transcriptional ArsR family regulator